MQIDCKTHAIVDLTPRERSPDTNWLWTSAGLSAGLEDLKNRKFFWAYRK